MVSLNEFNEPADERVDLVVFLKKIIKMREIEFTTQEISVRFGLNRSVFVIKKNDGIRVIEDLVSFRFAEAQRSDGVICYSTRRNGLVVGLVVVSTWSTETMIGVYKDWKLEVNADYLLDPKYLLEKESGSLFFSPSIIESAPKFRLRPTSVSAPRTSCHSNLREDLANSDGNTLFREIRSEFETLVAEQFDCYSDSEGQCVDPIQPVWDMENPSMNDEQKQDSERNDITRCQDWRIEHAAYYVPAHGGDLCRYGIHLTKRGIAHIANAVYERCRSIASYKDNLKHIIILASIQKLYAHEVCHAWIEYLCCLLDFEVGVRKTPSERFYAATNYKYNYYIFMEEAICNTFAYGLLNRYLMESDLLKSEEKETIMAAFACIMRRAPKGYCDFLAITESPAKSTIFHANVVRLLVEIYGPNNPGYIKDQHGSRDTLVVQDAVVEMVKLTLESLDVSDSDWVAGEPPLFIED